MSFPSNFKERILLLLVVLFPFYSVFSQTKEEIKNQIIEDRIEYLVESEEEPNIDYTTFFDHLSFYYDHPLNLNKVELDELQGLDLLSDIQINNLLDHIEKTGKLIALEELQTIKGFNKNTIQLILPFVKVSDEALLTRVSLKELVKNGSSQLFFRYQEVLEKKKGFTDINDSLLTQNPNARYAGNSSKLYTRYRYNYGPYLSIGFTAEKDAGEQFFAGTQKSGFDFYSAHLFLKNQGKLKQLAIGDYQVQFGQGLTYWSGIAFGKSSNVMLIKKSALGLKAWKSVV